jgi:hypothetical protein
MLARAVHGAFDVPTDPTGGTCAIYKVTDENNHRFGHIDLPPHVRDDVAAKLAKGVKLEFIIGKKKKPEVSANAAWQSDARTSHGPHRFPPFTLFIYTARTHTIARARTHAHSLTHTHTHTHTLSHTRAHTHTNTHTHTHTHTHARAST